ncbi:MAG: hypothetical protein RI973_1660 [Bacteroidota bacterium]|jgi:mono/diheme cytochrome c family protein
MRFPTSEFLAAVCLLAVSLQPASGQTKTWSEDVAPIVFNHCTSCHRAGEIAPFPLTNYQEAVAWGGMMAYVTEIKYMPPWKADNGFGVEYLRENFLTDDEIATIKSWVDAGMPQGDPANEPELPSFPAGSQVGTPDLVLSFAQTHLHPGNGVDEYRYFVLPTGLTTAKDLVALEMRPGNLQILHHALCWIDSTGTAAAYDAQTPEYGYLGNQGGGFAFGTQLPGYVPGQRPHVYSNGIAQRIPPNSDLVVQVHYAPTTTDEPDSSSFNLFFADQPAARYVQSKIMLPFAGGLTNGPFVIPANQVKEFHGVWTVPQDISMLGIAPHMHLLGTHWEVFGITPANDTINLIRISDWDFNWQGTFAFKKMIRLPQGTKIHAYAGYDNTTDNPVNPNNPPQLITWGEGTADEMFYLPLLFVPYQPGDEDLVLDGDVVSSTGEGVFHFSKTRLYPVSPNPASNGEVKIGFTLEQASPVNLRVYDLSGRQVAVLLDRKLAFAGEHVAALEAGSLQNGMYCVVLEAGGQLMTQRIVVHR